MASHPQAADEPLAERVETLIDECLKGILTSHDALMNNAGKYLSKSSVSMEETCKELSAENLALRKQMERYLKLCTEKGTPVEQMRLAVNTLASGHKNWNDKTEKLIARLKIIAAGLSEAGKTAMTKGDPETDRRTEAIMKCLEEFDIA